MAWRGLHLTQPARLTVADGQIVVDQEDEKVRLPLEDLAWIVLDSPRTTLTGALLSACTQRGVAIVVTDATHTPCGMMLPFHQHYRQGEVAHLQAAITVPRRKRLWQAIVQAKICNQAAALDTLGRNGGDTLRQIARHVGSGDPDNVEARAARFYWGELWPDFIRGDEGDRRNKLLNYGYAVIRACVARALVACGLLPAFGLKHASVSNAFNLADDVIEPFRPFIDVLAWRTCGQGRPCRDDLSLCDRRAMAGAPLLEARIGGSTATLIVAAEMSAESLVRAISTSSRRSLELPRLQG